MLFANIVDLFLQTICMGFFSVLVLIFLTVVFGMRFLGKNDQARTATKKIARGLIVKAVKRWLNKS
jgi:hypothetical protein